MTSSHESSYFTTSEVNRGGASGAENHPSETQSNKAYFYGDDNNNNINNNYKYQHQHKNHNKMHHHPHRKDSNSKAVPVPPIMRKSYSETIQFNKRNSRDVKQNFSDSDEDLTDEDQKPFITVGALGSRESGDKLNPFQTAANVNNTDNALDVEYDDEKHFQDLSGNLIDDIHVEDAGIQQALETEAA